jgi:glycosyltransferase involved in cell wall biosynthesis
MLNLAPGISVVIPVYNSQPMLAILVRRIFDVMYGVKRKFELILVNDGSTDGSWDEICALAETYNWVRGINLTRNYGQHNALLCGTRNAIYDVIVTLDDDLQNPPEEIPSLVTELNKGYDVVYGFTNKTQHRFWRRLGSKITRLALRSAGGAKVSRHASSFRIFRTSLRESFEQFQGPNVFIDVLLSWGTKRITSIAVRHDRRQIGPSNYKFRQLLAQVINLLTGFSVLPLQLASIIGLFLSLFGAGVLIYVLINYVVTHGSVPGFTFLAAIIAIFSGAQLLAIGIIGEYLGRMHFHLMNRPAYAILQQIPGSSDKSADS